tara:strand:- start:30529 stop:30780 length:252 start_codon:yes stop_codon:yes gene_type:complete
MISLPGGLLVAALLLIAALMLLYFQRLKIKDQKAAKARVAQVRESIQLNRNQLDKRHNYLNTYNFLAYNLNEVLIIQPEIAVR